MQQTYKANVQRRAATSRPSSGRRVLCLPCRAAAATASIASFDSLKAWVSSKGAKLDKASLSADILTDKPVLVATSDAQPGEVMISVPDSAWLSVENAKKSTVGKLAAEAGLDAWLVLALQLLADRFGSSKSELSTYAACIPEDLGTPLLWSDEELQELAGTQVLQTLSSYMTFFRSTFAQLQSGLFAANPAAFPPAAFTLPRFLWAVAAVRARALPPLEGDRIALAPLADMVSHRRQGNARLAVRSAGLFGRGQVLALEAARPIRKGETLALDFAPGRLDGPLLLDHGVLDGASPQPGYSLTLTLPDTDRFFDDKIDILESNGLKQSMTYNLTPDEQPGAEMMAFLRLLEIKGPDAFLLESIFRQDVWGFMQDPVSDGNEAAVCARLAGGARAALVGYPASLDQGLAALQSGALARGSRRETALLVRLGEQEALDALARFFEERGSPGGLKRLVYYQERRLRRLGLVDDEGRTTYDSFFKDGIA